MLNVSMRVKARKVICEVTVALTLINPLVQVIQPPHLLIPDLKAAKSVSTGQPLATKMKSVPC